MRFRLPSIADAKDHILASVLLVISLVLMFGRSQESVNVLRKVSITVFSYLEEPLSNIRVYRQALTTNTYLRKQNVLLQDELSRLRGAAQQNEELRQLLDFSRRSELNLFPIRIVAKELNQINNSLTVDAGSRQGIEVGMPMVTADGLVGRVTIVAAGYAQVMPFYNSLFRVSAKLQQSGGYGIVSWREKNLYEMQMDEVPQTVAVDSGEVVVTSGFSNQFPPDIPIGRVIRTEPAQGRVTQKIIIDPYVDLHQIAEGFIVKFQPDTTIERLNEQYRELFE